MSEEFEKINPNPPARLTRNVEYIDLYALKPRDLMHQNNPTIKPIPATTLESWMRRNGFTLLKTFPSEVKNV